MANGKSTAIRLRRPPSAVRGVSRVLGYVTLVVLLSLAGGLLFLANVFHSVARDLPSLDELLNYNPGGVTEIYATDKGPDGKNIVLGRLFVENREPVSITRVPQVLQDATVAIEDERFYQHPGVDLRGIARALWVNVRGGRLSERQGGSTLTQQLARNVYLTKRKTISRKVQEIMLAMQIEKNYSKQQILEMYLNEVYYGSGAYGVQAASKVYFGRRVQDLSLSQAALLAGLPQQPGRFSPFEDKNAALARRNTVLAKMAELGYIKPAAAKVARGNGIRLVAEKPKNQFEAKAPYFVKYIERQLVEQYGLDSVYKGGLKVYTTLNWKMQREAERALINGVAAARDQRVGEGALVCLEPHTGYIRAMVGGVDYKRNEYNNVTQARRQPGSSFKVFVYTAAFDTHRFGPDSRVEDEPVSFPGGNGKRYSPQDYGGRYHGWVTLDEALTHSYNVPAVRVAEAIGPATVIRYAKRMGITSPLKPDLSIALGADDVSPLEMAAAYCVFPSHGNRVRPMSIVRILNHDNEVLEENPPRIEAAIIPETTVAQISDILAHVVEYGTAAGAAGIHEIENAHGKTGTTNENKDAWFIGYTPELCTAVWVCGAKFVRQGNRAIVDRYVPMAGVTGGHVCAPIWARFMKTAVAIQRTSGEPAPPSPEKTANRTITAVRRTPDTRFRNPAPRTVAAAGTYRDRARDMPALSPAPTNASPASSMPGALPAASAPAPGGHPIPDPVITRGLKEGASTPAAVLSPAPAIAPRPPQEITVTICADSGQRATRWCPETVTRTLSVARAPRGICRLHRPRPGDG